MVLLLFLLALFGIGVVGSTTEESSSDSAPARPPALELRSEAGTQLAAQGSYCVTGESVGECVDVESPVGPEQTSVVRPGEIVTIAVVGADDIQGSASVRRLGCDEELLLLTLEPETRWTVELEPGAYEIAMEAVTFEAGSTSGDTSGVLGVV
ncbi:MAG: hypothetical protein ACRDNA_14615, partial [Gaiellaceae bacterium]